MDFKVPMVAPNEFDDASWVTFLTDLIENLLTEVCYGLKCILRADFDLLNALYDIY